jgi:hypothetical protein
MSRAAGTHTGKGPVDTVLQKGYAEAADASRIELELDMGMFGPPLPGDPGVLLMEELARANGHVRDIRKQIDDLEDQDLVWNKVLELEESRSGGQGGDYSLARTEIRAEINQWWLLYERERKHMSTVAAACVRAGLEERRVRLAEKGVDRLEEAFIAALEDIGVDPHDGRVRAALGVRLQQAIEGGAMEASANAVRVPSEREREPVVLEGQAVNTLPAPVRF